MTEPDNAHQGQETQTSGEIAADLFSDISNPAVETAAAETPTGSETEQVIPSVSDFQQPKEEPPTVVNEPVAVVAPVVANPTAVAAPVVAPVQYTPEQVAAFQQWQAAQQQQVIPQAAPVAAPVAAPAPAQQQLSQEEIDTAINRFKVTPESFNALFTEEDPVKASAILDGMLQSAVKQAVTMSVHLIRDTQAQIQQSVQPYMQFADTQREVMLREQFFQTNPDLRGQDLVINTVMQQLAAARQTGQYAPASEQQVFQDVATRSKALIAQMQQQGQQVPQRAVAATPQGKPSMVTLPTVSGGAGAGSAGVSQTATNGVSQIAQSIFG